MLPFPKKDEVPEAHQPSVLCLKFPSAVSPVLITASIQHRPEEAGIKADLQLGTAVFAPGRLEKSPCTEELFHSFSHVWFSLSLRLPCTSIFLDEKQGTALKIISMVLPFIYIQVFWVPEVLVLSFHKQGFSQYENMNRELSNHLATARALAGKQTNKQKHIRHIIKNTRTGNMVSAKLLLLKSCELPILGC